MRSEAVKEVSLRVWKHEVLQAIHSETEPGQMQQIPESKQKHSKILTLGLNDQTCVSTQSQEGPEQTRLSEIVSEWGQELCTWR